MKRMLAFGLALTLTLIFGGSVMTQQATSLSAGASDPEALGWMQGFPLPVDKVIRFADSDYFAFPKLRWTVYHFRELMPTAGVDNGIDAVRQLPVALDPSIDAVTFTPLGSDKEMTWGAAFDANLHRRHHRFTPWPCCL